MFCTACGYAVAGNSNYCPNCGARMAAPAQYVGASAAPNTLSVNQALANLQIQLNQGDISEQEFHARRAQILSQAGVSVPPSSGVAPVADAGSIGWWFLGFFFPIVGLILYLVWKDDKPLSARRAGWGALISVIAVMVAMVLTYALAFLLIAMA